MSTSAYVSDRALFEVYYPPFAAAAEAGVASLMCSYNRINGTHACNNAHTLGQLRANLSFSGWVVSDWWAGHDWWESVQAGLDVMMPGNDGKYTRKHLHRMPQSDEREVAMVTHVLYGMLASGALNSSLCTAGCDCEPILYGVNATSDEHVALARRIAAESAVLLKNDVTNGAGTLPLPPGATLALAGSACAAPHQIDVEADDWKRGDYYVVGGSGRVVSDRAVSILEGLRAAGLHVPDERVSRTDAPADALAAAAGASHLLVCASGTTSEDQDRPNLRVDQHDLLVALAAAAHSGELGVPLVVALMAPGQLAVAPWATNAAAVVTMFLGGQETGNGWADVLTGRMNPSAKLPVTFYAESTDARPDGPCVGAESLHCDYQEGLAVGWKGVPDTAVGFAFGHGLSYTTFAYEWQQRPALTPEGGVRLRVTVRNTGEVAGAEVCQLYVRYPADAGEPTIVLRGFEKTPVLPAGGAHTARFTLTRRDLSIWSGGWTPVAGNFTFLAGTSSQVLPIQADLLVA